MKARECDIETEDGREVALRRLVNEVLYQYADIFLTKPSRANDTGKLSTLEFARLGKEQFRIIEQNILTSHANIPLAGVLRTSERYMPQMNKGYVGFMIEQHGEKYDTVLNAYDLENSAQRVACLRALYKAHGLRNTALLRSSDGITFDRETEPHDVMTRIFSNSAHINKPIDAARNSYIGFMNAVCDLFLDVYKQDPAVIALWNSNNIDPNGSGCPGGLGCAA